MAGNTFRLAIGQISSVRADVDHNLAVMAEYAERAREQGATHLVFPELALTGYLIDDRFVNAARGLKDPAIQRLCDLSSEIDLSFGFIEETSTNIFYNSALHLSGGRILHLHRKIYPPTYGIFDERRYFGTGWEVSAFDTPHGRMAILICGDAWHLPLAYMAAHDGADFLLILAASSRQGLSAATPCVDAWHWMCQSYALTLSCFVVFANFGSGDDTYDFWGGSFVAGPDGNIVARSGTVEPDLLCVDLDRSALRRQRVQLPFRRDDSLAHTVQLGQRILRAKIRRDGFLADRDAQDLPPAAKPM